MNNKTKKCPRCTGELDIKSGVSVAELSCHSCGYESVKDISSPGAFQLRQLLSRTLDRHKIEGYISHESPVELDNLSGGDFWLTIFLRSAVAIYKEDVPSFANAYQPFKIITNKDRASSCYWVVYKSRGGEDESEIVNGINWRILRVLKWLVENHVTEGKDGIKRIDMDVLININYEASKFAKYGLINKHEKGNLEGIDIAKSLKKKAEKERGQIDIVTEPVSRPVENGALHVLRDLHKEGARLEELPELSVFESTLNNEFPWFKAVTKLIISELKTRFLGNKAFSIPNILMLSAPGVGKTAYCIRLAELIEIPYKVFGMGGNHSNLVLAGMEFGWTNSHPSLALQTIMDTNIANPLIILDEIDKAGGSTANGYPHHTLLGLLETSSSKSWFDPYLKGHVDLSHVNWIATANSIEQLPKTLLSRLRVVNVGAPKKEDYPAIVWHVRNAFIKTYGISKEWLPVFGEAEWRWLEQYYTTPRMIKRATEELLKSLINNPEKLSIN